MIVGILLDWDAFHVFGFQKSRELIVAAPRNDIAIEMVSPSIRTARSQACQCENAGGKPDHGNAAVQGVLPSRLPLLLPL
jgi:hypothetical protein